jgi:hypothetical protein
MAYVLEGEFRRRIWRSPILPLVQNSSEFLADASTFQTSIQFQNWWYERILLPLMNTPAKQRFPRDDGAGTYSGGRLYPTLQSAYSRSGPNSRALLISFRPAPRAR